MEEFVLTMREFEGRGEELRTKVGEADVLMGLLWDEMVPLSGGSPWFLVVGAKPEINKMGGVCTII